MTNPIHPVARLASRVGFVALMLTAAPSYAQSPGASPEMSTEDLKSVYLDCERDAVVGRLDGTAAMQCSIFYEDLKRRVFVGDFQSMRTWSDAQRRATGIAARNFRDEI